MAEHRKSTLWPSMTSDHQRIGYGNPPLHTRFAPGHSGNPKGRPKNRKKLGTLLDQVVNERIMIQEGDSRRSVTNGEVVLRTLLFKAMKGGDRAIRTLFEIAIRGGEFEKR
jgi:hypothetical protein